MTLHATIGAGGHYVRAANDGFGIISRLHRNTELVAHLSCEGLAMLFGGAEHLDQTY